MPCVPVALNSGLFWPRRSFLRYPGTIVVEFLDPIPPGLDKDAFFGRLQNDIETATARLVAEGRARARARSARRRLTASRKLSRAVACASCEPFSRSARRCRS